MADAPTILVVDDNRDSRELVLKVLSRQGFRLLEAADGKEALAAIAAQKPDLVLLDLSLPEMDGFEVARHLKAQENYRNMPVIAITAHAMKGDREKALAAGCDGYITKPINVRELPGQIREFLA